MGIFSGNKDTVGIDIGTSSIKIAQIKKSGKDYNLILFDLIELSPESIVDGGIRETGNIIGALKELYKRNDIKTKNAVISVSGHSVIMKKIRLPRIPEEELKTSIQWEAEHHVPFAIDDVYLDCQIVGESSSDPNSMDVMLVAVKKTKVNEYVNVINEAGLYPVIVDVDAFALENQFELNNIDREGVIALIDIGAGIMKTNVLRNGISSFARDVSFGGNNYTRAISENMRIEFDKAEKIKKGEEESSWDDIVPVLEKISRDLNLEIQRTFDYFHSTTELEKIDRIILSGGCARIKGIDAYLSSSLNIPTEIANPFKNIAINAKKFDADFIREVAPRAAVVIGLALRRPQER